MLLIIYLKLGQLVPTVLSARLKILVLEHLSAVHHATYILLSSEREKLLLQQSRQPVNTIEQLLMVIVIWELL